ncbi:ATP-dependent RecD-like DNA helicase [Bartonella sp. TP]|uniref:ATP-dependent DNA helicase n=1 Tax=Bartonella sp. TP TaxID=3057550 RepID=UPI0025B207E8|nr:ATP-dependent RecD-like DNA helicase [Bartonella sp. TP]WJW79784.1 ATP-dependent RecD-like DNA helicase [Bartonella sp. TP]
MQLSVKQELALKEVESWFKKKQKPIFRLFGYAGTGKTTLAKYFASTIGEKVRFAAYTGKAAQVLRSKGAYGASTIHSLIYRPTGLTEVADEVNGQKMTEPSFVLNRDSDILKARLVVIDECSMVDQKLGQDLLSFGVPILVLGDPGQLPPIGGGGFFTNHKPDIQLEEIFRQAQDNMILHFSKLAREGQPMDYGDYGDVKIIKRQEITASMVLAADQVLIGTHKTRRLYNKRIRELLGFSTDLPAAGDKLVAQRNNAAKGLMNGSCWKVLQAGIMSGKPYMNLLIKAEDEPQKSVKVKLLKESFINPLIDIPWQLKKRYDDFEYGYALTVHKAQGSQWDNILLFDESYAFREDKEKWLYTAITRAAKTLTIVR